MASSVLDQLPKLPGGLSPQIAVALLAAIVAVVFLQSRKPKTFLFKGKRYPLFPGPSGVPVLGNLHQLSATPEKRLTEWAKTYGPVYRLKLGVREALILTSPTAVRDLMVDRGANNSSRLEFEVLGKEMLQMGGIGATQYNDMWRLHRRIANSFLHPRALDKFNDVIDEEGANFVRTLYADSRAGPINPLAHCARFPLNSMLWILYGWRTQGVDDPIVATAMDLGERFAEITGILQNAVDFLPVLKLLPNKNVLKARNLHQEFIKVWGGLIKRNADLMEKGEGAPESLSAILYDNFKQGTMSWTEVCMLSTGIMLAGIETTAGTIAWLIAIISLRPDLQAKAHAQLDEIVGHDRMPDFTDEESLTYIKCLLKETLRYRNPFPQSIPHMSVEDDVYDGHFIPKETVLMMNVWGMHFDGSRYPDPEAFNPDRFAGDNLSAMESANLKDPNQRDHWAFGAGRRICVGTGLSEREMYLAVSRLLWAFRIEPLKGEEVDIDKYTGELPRTPPNFKINLVPRHSGVKAILQES